MNCEYRGHYDPMINAGKAEALPRRRGGGGSPEEGGLAVSERELGEGCAPFYYGVWLDQPGLCLYPVAAVKPSAQRSKNYVEPDRS